MITDKRLKWLQAKKKRGDILAVVKELNPKNSKNGVTYSEAASILNGNLWGTFGQAVTDTLEHLINKRNRQIEKDKKKYSTNNHVGKN